MRHSDGTWEKFADLRTVAGDPGNVATVSCAAIRNRYWPANVFHVGVIVSPGRVVAAAREPEL
jgi:hypothetical protein